MRAGVPIVPIAVVGAEDAMPIFAHVPLLQRLTGLIYFPVNHAFPHFGLAAGAMYLPGQVQDQVPGAGRPVLVIGPSDAEDLSLVQNIAEDIRSRIQTEVDELVASRTSVWFG